MNEVSQLNTPLTHPCFMTIAIFICPTLQFCKKQTAIETCQVQDDGAKIDLLSGPLPDGMLNRCMKTGTRSPICGRILEHCKEKKLSFREAMGIRLCVFKIGVTTDPLTRYQSYREKGFTSMWVIFSGDSVDLVHVRSCFGFGVPPTCWLPKSKRNWGWRSVEPKTVC